MRQSIIRRILVAVDGRRDSRQVIHYGARIAAATHAELSLLHVAKLGMDGDQREWATEWGTARSGEVFRTHRLVMPGKRAETIVKHANDMDADLILMPACKRGLLGQLLFGSTPMDVIRGTNRPVWIVKPPLDAEWPFHGRRILCCVKLGAEGRSLLRYAARWASALQGKLLLVHAVPLISEAMLASYGFEDWGELELMPKAAERRITCMAEGIGAPYEVEVVTGGVAANLRKLANRWRADVVIAGRGRKGLGGNAGEIIARSPCSVISYREEHRGAAPVREAARRQVLQFPRRG
ncbi:MAG: universal stress protein [Bryobacterales bacterium]|nr:universal stress protein [Bryobacterales bacterium]